MKYDIESVKNDIITSYSRFIKNFYKEHGETSSSQKRLSDELFEREFGNEIDTYNKKTHQFDKKMGLIHLGLQDLEDKKLAEKESLENILKNVKKNLELLKHDRDVFEDIKHDLKEYRNVISNFKDRFASSKTKLNDLINQVSKYEIEAKDEIHEILDKIKHDLKDFLNEEHNKIIKFVEEKGKDIIADKYNIEKLKIEDNRNKLFNFDFSNFLKYLLLIFCTGFIIWLDFYLIQDVIIKSFGTESFTWSGTQSYKNIIENILPLIPTGILILVEFWIIKYLPNHKTLHKVTHAVAFLVLLLIILSTIFNINSVIMYLAGDEGIASGSNWWFNVEFQVWEIIIRILLFLVAIPTIVYALVAKFNFDEFVKFIGEILYLPFGIILYPFRKIYSIYKYKKDNEILKNKKNNLLKKSYEFHIDFDKLDKLFQIKKSEFTDIFSIPRTFNHDMLEFESKSELVLNKIIDFESHISKDETKVKKGFGKSSKENNAYDRIDNKIERLKESIKEIGVLLQEQEEYINKKYQSAIDAVLSQINDIKSARRDYKDEYEHNKKTVKKAIAIVLNDNEF